jgi:hypothetical protein
VPVEQRLVVGTEATVVPLEEPQTPFVGWGVAEMMVKGWLNVAITSGRLCGCIEIL